MKNLIIILFLVLLCLSLLIFTNWRVRDKVTQFQYDWQHKNELVYTKAEVDKILKGIEKISFSDLDNEYLQFTKSNEKKYKKLIRKLTYYKVKREDLNKRIAGRFRLKEFISKDKYYKDCILGKEKEVICIFNPKIFYKTIELLDELENLAYDKQAFEIVNGHRHPSYNEEVGGASLSRHIKGEAVDIVVNDINKDGYIDKSDKDIILDLLENKIIRNEGGIGLYPGTRNVHYDVRGTRARWNSY